MESRIRSKYFFVTKIDRFLNKLTYILTYIINENVILERNFLCCCKGNNNLEEKKITKIVGNNYF